MRKPVLLINALCSLLLQSACATEPKTLPQPPYSEAQLNGFVNQEELGAVSKIAEIQNELNSGVSVFEMSDLLVENKPREDKAGLFVSALPGGLFHDIELDGQTYIDEHTRSLTLTPSSISFDRQGNVATVQIENVSAKDADYINQLSHLQAISISGSAFEGRNVDVAEFNSGLQLQAWTLSYVNLKNIASLCHFKTLEFVGIDRSEIAQNFSTTGCFPNLETLAIYHVKAKSGVIKDMPKLRFLRLADSSWQSITLDGASLPNLKSVAMGNVNISSGFDKVQLPAGLPQLYLNDSENDAITQLKLPENLQYLDLSNAQLSDYSFIRQSKNLRYLNLESSNFDDWAILKELTSLQALNVSHTTLSNEALSYFSILSDLNFLSLADTKVTDGRALSQLKKIKFLNVGDTKIDFDKFPDIEHTAYVNFPDERYYESDSYPAHIARMKETKYAWPLDCFRANDCIAPPWLEFSRK
jgi:Leucine-rich repeat (LRR) protein